MHVHLTNTHIHTYMLTLWLWCIYSLLVSGANCHKIILFAIVLFLIKCLHASHILIHAPTLLSLETTPKKGSQIPKGASCARVG